MPDPITTWVLVMATATAMCCRWAYMAGKRRGAEEERAAYGLPRPAEPPPPTATITGTVELRDGMTVDEVAEALGITPQKVSESLRR